MSKPNVIKSYNNLEPNLRSVILQKFPYGFDKHLITFTNHKNKLISALPFETTEYKFLIKMTKEEAFDIVNEEKNKARISDVENSILNDVEVIDL